MKRGHMLKKIRILLAAVFFTCISLLFLDFTGSLHAWLGWMAKIQFLPAVLAANTIIVAALMLVTVLFGRIYCSVICPLGVMQDIFSWVNGSLKRKNRFRFGYRKEKKWLRYGFLIIFIVLMAVGAHSLAALIAPYSAYGRIASNLLAPLYHWTNNFLAWIAERADSYAFYEKEVWIKSLPVFITSAVTFIILFIMAWKGGRTYCNTVCPVGTILGFFARRSIFAPVIEPEKCSRCGLCERQCRSSCIDSQSHEIDYSRCVTCMDCIATCKEGAAGYVCRYGKGFPIKSGMTEEIKGMTGDHDRLSADHGRRAFLISGALVTAAVAAKAHGTRASGIPAAIRHTGNPQRQTPIVPAGSVSQKNLADHCTACQLCVSVCPNDVLSPSSSLQTLMQPEMSYEKGYCRPECNRCSQVCPTGAIRPVSIEEKSSIQTGHAVVDLDICVVNTDEVSCGNCARHCPAEAITMVPQENGTFETPAVDEERCIGCGACEYLCPARPVKAIHVEGHPVHKTI